MMVMITSDTVLLPY